MSGEGTSPKRAELRREIGLAGFFSLAFGSMIGVGWVTALGGWLELAGPLGTVVAFLAGGALMVTIGLCYAELTPMLPLAGGEVAYAYKAWGTGKSFVVGWFLAFGYLSVSAFEAISVGKVTAFLVPSIDCWPLWSIAGSTVYGGHVVLAFVTTAAIAWINYRGARRAAQVQTWLTFGFLAMVLVFVIAGLARGDVQNLEPLWGPAKDGVDDAAGGAPALGGVLAGILAVFVTVPFWFVGFDTIPQGAEEAQARVPPRLLGLTILVAIVAATVFYALIVLCAAAAKPWPQIVGSELPTAEAFEAALGSTFGRDMVLVAALVGLLTSWNGFFLAGSRVLFALGRGRIIDERFGTSHPRHGTPSVAVIFSGVITFGAALLGRGAMIALVDVGAFCIAIAFLGVTLSTIRLRRRFPDLERPYRMPGGLFWARVAVLGSCAVLGFLLVPGSPAALRWPLEWGILAAFIALGVAFWYAGRTARARTSDAERAWHILGERES